ncbi:MAG: LptF/LptG family permease [Phycisphaerae bacterium]|nr:LptF/LptG family permease [Phycisphaerae bacterium]
MPLRLYKHSLGELVRVICFTAAVLAVVTAFGAIIKPLAGDAPLSAAQAVKYVGLSMVPMMQYALPFAAGFGATIVLHRMATDNEVMAMAVSGLRYRTILAPVMALGVLLVLIMVLLVQVAIPRVYAIMGRIIAGDLTALMAHAVDHGQPVRFGDMEIWAESMRVVPNPADSDADERIELRRMVAAKIGRGGGIESDVSAAAAVLDLYEREGIVLIRLAMDDAVSWDATAGSLRGFPRLEPTHAVPVPLPERTEPMAMTQAELLAVDADPSRYPSISAQYQTLKDELRQAAQRRAIGIELGRVGHVDFQVADQTGHQWRVDATALEHGVLRGSPSKSVTITELNRSGAPLRVFLPQNARVSVEDGGFGGVDRRLVLDMHDVTVKDPPRTDRPNHRAAVLVGNIRPLEVDAAPVDETSSELLARGQAAESVPQIRRVLDRIEHETQNLHGQVVSRLWRRWAVAATAGLLPLLGAILALNMRSAQPLSIYLVAFVPALLNLVLISGGSGFMRQGDVLGGLAVMWSGNIVLLIIIAIGWRRLARH